MNSQNELGNQSQNELNKAIKKFNEEYNRDNCIELLWYSFFERYNLKPIPNSYAVKDIPNGFIAAQSYQTDWGAFYVEKTWITDTGKLLDKKMIDLKIRRIGGE